MDASQIGLFALAERRLSWVDQRQTLLSQNIANADTPGYRSHDLSPFAAQLGQLAMAPAEQGASLGSSADASFTTTTTAHERGVDGNTVSMDDELAKIAQDDNTHQLVTGLYHSYMGMFMTALGKSG